MVRINEMIKKKYVVAMMTALSILLVATVNTSQAQSFVPTYSQSEFIGQFVENNEYDPTLSVKLTSEGLEFENVSGLPNEFLNDLSLKVASGR